MWGRRNLDLARIVALSCLLPPTIFLLPQWASPLRMILGFLFALVIPGYALGAALFPRSRDLDELERLVLTLGLSVAVIPLVGLIIDYTPWSLSAISLALGVVVTSLLGCAVALLRRSLPTPLEGAATAEPGTPLPGESAAQDGAAASGGGTERAKAAASEGGERRRVRLGGLELLAMVAIAWVLVVVAVEAIRPPAEATEFYLLGDAGSLEAYPQQLRAGEPFELTVAVTNFEGRPEPFEVRVELPGGRAVIPVPILAHGETWTETLRLTAPVSEGRSQVVLELFRAGEANPYRSLRLWLTISAAAPSDLPAAALV